ncbi:MAG: SEC-C domain-containing protein [Clostridiales Family XIII bacterium]|jgi:hypothetical protein|nr:SEC-C domain-containing protein [Clostridiales Family XIII bacterium]
MSYFKDWLGLAESQTKATFNQFWEEYCEAEKKIYTAVLADVTAPVAGTFAELVARFDVKPALFMGFLDGAEDSLTAPYGVALADVTDETALSFTVEPEKLYFNMLAADAEHLWSLPAWDGVLSSEKREEITAEFKRSRTVRKDKTPGRNDPCPCGSGLKYKKCCGKSA